MRHAARGIVVAVLTAIFGIGIMWLLGALVPVDFQKATPALAGIAFGVSLCAGCGIAVLIADCAFSE